ncbi:MAG: type II toxin-antitoxin system RelE family toxin [Syntrophobacteraceae bacterium]
MIPYRVEFAKPAIKQLAKLPQNIRQKISVRIGHHGDVYRSPRDVKM